jgi:hypothetical protein
MKPLRETDNYTSLARVGFSLLLNVNVHDWPGNICGAAIAVKKYTY